MFLSIVFRNLIEQAYKEKRVLLTRDAKLFRHEYLIQNQIYRVKSLLKNDQLVEVCKSYTNRSIWKAFLVVLNLYLLTLQPLKKIKEEKINGKDKTRIASLYHKELFGQASSKCINVNLFTFQQIRATTCLHRRVQWFGDLWTLARSHIYRCVNIFLHLIHQSSFCLVKKRNLKV